MTSLYPFLLTPNLQTRVWGGRRLATMFNKMLPTTEPYGEAWELHDHCVIANGALQGQTLRAAINTHGRAIIGDYPVAEGMPLLVKLLDASDWLSVQVHPNDEQARALENDPRGKTEAWLVLAAEPESQIVIGVQAGTSREAMAQAIETGTLEKLLVYQTVQAGDVLYLAANTVHALGPGLVIYEIQQSSDITYRLYDWNRVGLDGKPRALHIEKGVQVSNVDFLPTITHPDGELLLTGQYFTTLRHRLADGTLVLPTEGRFHALTCIDGTVQVSANEVQVTLEKGQTALIPAALSEFLVQGKGVVLRSSPA